jgi:transposase
LSCEDVIPGWRGQGRQEYVMRGSDEGSGWLFSYVDIEARVPATDPVRHIRELVNGALAKLDQKFETLYSADGRPSIPPERLVRASLLQLFYSIRSERS